MSSSPQAYPELRFQGLGVSRGIALGPAVRMTLHGKQPLFINVLPHRIPYELKRLHRALLTARHHLERIRTRLNQEVGRKHSYILDPHILMLNDAMLTQMIEENIRLHRVNAEWGVKISADALVAACERMDSDYLRERSADIQDVSNRLIDVLSGRRNDAVRLTRPSVVFAEDLLPTVLAEMDISKVLAIATDAGGWATHTAIIARSLGIPTALGLRDCSGHISNGMECVLDGTDGVAILNPTRTTRTLYVQRQEQERRRHLEDISFAALPAVTADGEMCQLLANVEIQSELPALQRLGKVDIGLFRSEFLLPNALEKLPDEDAQTAIYRQVIESATGGNATVRTFDFTAEKVRPHESFESNPALGLHGVRLWLQSPEVARTQMRALLRAGKHGGLRILLPRVSCLSELRAAKALMAEMHKELARECTPHAASLPLGVMIEIPSAVFICHQLAREADFLSVGSNDLIQHLLAVDRGNQHVAHLYQPFHPAVLASLQRIVETGRRMGVPIFMCGEMAANPLCALILLGMGMRNFSLSATGIADIKRLIRQVRIADAERMYHAVSELETPEEIERRAREAAESLGVGPLR
jgi:phosphoenolpyruvate-protein phosphotransferase